MILYKINSVFLSMLTCKFKVINYIYLIEALQNQEGDPDHEVSEQDLLLEIVVPLGDSETSLSADRSRMTRNRGFAKPSNPIFLL